MMNIKHTINFKTLREKGPGAIDVKEDEVVQLISRGKDIKVIVSQGHYLELLQAYNQMLIRRGLKDEEVANVEERMNSFEERLSEIAELSKEDEKEESSKWSNGQKAVGSN